jgi:hypothetical protein
MKNNPTLHDRNNPNNLVGPGNGLGLEFKLGLDLDLRQVVVAIQCGRGGIGPGRKLSRAQLVAWVEEKIAQGHVVPTVYECCGFGAQLA